MKRLKSILSLVVLFSFFIVLPTQVLASSAHDELMQSAKEDGTVRVIVALDHKEFKAEGKLNSAAAVQSQRSKITRLQDALLNANIPGKIANVKRFKYSPYLALEVDSTALSGIINDRER